MSKYFFVVQGEGRGHLTQAIALHDILQNAGHQVVAVWVGTAPQRSLPVFFAESISCAVQTFDSPSLVYNKRTKALSIRQTIQTHLPHVHRYFRSVRHLHEAVKEHQPDVIVNFYEMVGGLFNWLYRPATPMVCVGHQYLFLHETFVFPNKRFLDRCLVNLNSWLTSLGAHQRLALSFRPMPASSKRGITVVPPLLRQVVRELEPTKQRYLLAYTTQHGMAEGLVAWHARHTHLKVHCFWDNPEAQGGTWHYHHGQLAFHPIDAQKFLSMMQHCAGLITTAGFESVSEAMYLGKPVMMIPLPNHFEQACNALDAARAGAGIRGGSFDDLDEFLNYLPHHESVQERFRHWQDQAPSVFVTCLEQSRRVGQVYKFTNLLPLLRRKWLAVMQP
jgi:uncharacterized protein (TIGR00661 family)